MGCLHSSDSSTTPKTKETPEKKVYSWDNRPQIDPKDYTISGLKDETIAKLPGEVDGRQFIIENCENCKIYIFDYSAAVTVDNLNNCQVFIAPSKGSVYIRNSNQCKFALACQQFRTRDCKKIDIFLCCNTQPIIESSSSMKFACFQYYYPELEGQFDKAGVSLYNNNWSGVYDFTPAADEETWGLLSENAKLEDYIPLPPTEKFPQMTISTDLISSVIPLTHGSRRKVCDESCLVVFYPGDESRSNVKLFSKEIFSSTNCKLVQTKQVQMSGEDAKRVFGENQNIESIHQGPVIALEINGDNSVTLCNEIIEKLFKGRAKQDFVFISSNAETAAQDIDNFYNFVDMTMS